MKMGAANLNRESFPIFGAVGRRFGSTLAPGGRGWTRARVLATPLRNEYKYIIF